jgi:hypothetical protein
MVGGEFGAAVTVRVNAGSDADNDPSLTEMTMLAYEPTLLLVGVPDSRPVEVLKVAQEGLFTMANASAWPSGSLADGVKLYAIVACTDVDGEPEMDGAELGGGVTVIANAGKDADKDPSLTEITMLE